MAVAITNKPNTRVKNLGSPTRGSGNRRMSASWKVPPAMTKEKSKSRAQELDIHWVLTTAKSKKTLKKEVSTSTTSSSINLANFSIGSTSYTRQSFYPVTSLMLKSVTVKVRGKNSKGAGKWATATREFKKPRKPTVSAIAFDTSNGQLSTTISTNAGEDYQERYDTRYTITVRLRTGSVVTVYDTSTTDTSLTRTYDASDYQNLTTDQYIRMNVTAWSRGYAGSSDKVTKKFYLAYPKKATITRVDITSGMGQCIANIDTNQTTEHPVDTVELQYLADVTYATASAIPITAEWVDSEVVDDGECKALAMSLAPLLPSVGKYSYIRIKSARQNLVRYSEPFALKELHTDSVAPEADDVDIISATPRGNSAIVQLGWNADGQDDSTGTELSWAMEEDTWKSTDDPNTHEFTWSDGRYPATGTLQYHDSAQITIKGLAEGTKYYIKARRYLIDDDDNVLYGKYSNQATVITYESPEAVTASCDSFIAAGDSLPVYWTFTGKGIQKQWQIKTSNGKTLKGNGSIGATQISSADLSRLAVNNVLTFQVGVSTGSEFVWSESHKVTIQQRPTISLNVPATLTAQPLSFTATCSTLSDLVVIVTSQGASGQFPQGFRTQVADDTIYSDLVTPIWSSGSATISLPSGLDFWDLGSYTVTVTAIDRSTGLRSAEPAVASFVVSWANQAVDPDDAVTIVPMDYTLENGDHIQAVEIELTPPANSNSSDLYDIYRMDGENAHLIGEGFPLTATVVDNYAPFGDDVFYRIALRTVDGDVEYADKEYELISDTIRFDWVGGTLELPYGISIGDAYKKDVEFRSHLDGTVDGYWNQGIERKGSYSSSVIKLIQPNEINLARQLARYAGAVFVRTANGSAYTADVQVTDLSVKNQAVTLVAFDATEVELTDEFMLTSPYELGDE